MSGNASVSRSVNMSGNEALRYRLIVLAILPLLGLSCSLEEPVEGLAAPWDGTISTEGNVTTVVNESGSVWGGTARLVEEVSIGVESGAEEYMFGQITGLAATDERIYVADGQLHTIRVYDSEGNHLFDFGRRGQGPGEFENITELAVDPAGRVFVQSRSRLAVFDLDGNLLTTWPYGAAGRSLTLAADGSVYVPVSWVEEDEVSERNEQRTGYVPVAPNGTAGARIAAPAFDDDRWQLVARQGGRARFTRIPYAPQGHWTVLPSGATVTGFSDFYRFEVEYPDRSLIVERSVELPAVPAEEPRWQTEYWTASMRAFQPDWSWTAPPVPDHLPAYQGFRGDRYGRVWVVRAVRLEAVAECDPDPTAVEGRRPRPCWRPIPGLDVFNEGDGRYLGRVPLPDKVRPPSLVFLEEAILTAVEDEVGTIEVKRYRLETPSTPPR